MHASMLLGLLPLVAAAPGLQRRAPVIVPRGGSPIENKYIVRMKPNSISTATNSAISSITADADFTYSRSFSGFMASLTKEEVERLQLDENVDYIEQDAQVHMLAIQENAPWGLARISSAQPNTTTYTYDESAGEGTCAYVLDTGIDVDHPDFEGRATFLKNFAGGGDGDVQGHGTHCAGTIGSKTYGVAKKTKLFSLKVLDDTGYGSNAAVIAAMEHVVDDVPNRPACKGGAVVNMSLGGPFSQAVNDAAASIADAGIFLAAASSNEGVNAKTSSPGSEPKVCTVGATERDDGAAPFSNFGAVVDVHAPGVGIKSLAPGNGTAVHDGTSMAAPHVAGLAAYLMGNGRSAEGLCEYLAKTGLDVVKDAPKGTTTKLVNNGHK